jgi:EAL domain-containing protein (putative c-di-GMP-specific phosphodiesterase class I)
MARDLGLATVAEGVEDLRTLAELRELGCDRAQGFFLGRPAAAGDCATHLSLGRWQHDRHDEAARPPAGL